MEPTISLVLVEKAMQRLAVRNPLIQCITNYVSMDLMANVLLAAGASPAMVRPLTGGLVSSTGGCCTLADTNQS